MGYYDGKNVEGQFNKNGVKDMIEMDDKITLLASKQPNKFFCIS